MCKLYSFIAFALFLTTTFSSPVKSNLGAKGTEWCDFKSDLPDGIVAVKYIESTGEQYIDTGILMDYSHITFGGTLSTSSAGTGGFGFGFALSALTSYNRSFNVEETSNARIMFNIYGGGNFYSSDFYSALSETDCSVSFIPSPHELTIGEASYTFSSIDWAPTDIFCFGNGKVFGSVRIKRVWIRQDGELVRDLIAVRFINEYGQKEGALYDLVTGMLFENQGTGSFLIGPDGN